VAVQPDGKIVVGVRAATDAFTGLVALRLKPSGELDPSFGSGGEVFAKPNPLGADFDVPSIDAIALQPDGKILLGGQSELFHAGQLLVARLNEVDGSFDPSFGDGGRLLLSLQPRDSSRPFSLANALAVQPDGNILVAGRVEMVEISDLVLMRLAGKDGAPDPTFGDAGKLLYGPFGDECGAHGSGNAIGLQPDGKVVVAGNVGGAVDCNAPVQVFRSPGLIGRFTGGGWDQTFGSGGALFTDTVPGGPATASFQGLAVRPDGRIVVGGSTADSGDRTQSIVARFNGGALDPAFGSGGQVTRQLANGAASSQLAALALQPDGKILAAGFAGNQVVVMRLLGDATQGDGSTGGGGAGGQNPANPLNLVATLAKLGITPAAFAAADSGPSIARTVGAQVSYENTQAATTMFTVLKRTRGVRHKRRCMRPGPNRHGKGCVRWVVSGRFTHADKAGLNSFHFSGRLNGRKLKPGQYRLRARPRFAGPDGKAVEVRFQIVR
jgi:uncharacterized delta-60 repeat protein